MFFEYMRVINPGGGDTLSFSESYPIDLIIRIVLILLTATVLIVIGYKIKEGWGAVVAFSLCVFIFLYVNGLFRYVGLF
jgi:hypothetical protein